MTVQRRNGALLALTFVVLTVVTFGPSRTSGPIWVSSSWAADGPRTACIALPTDKFSQKAAAVLNHLARENFRRAKSFKLLDTRELLNKTFRDPRQASMDKARQLLEEGKDQYDNLELDAAIEALQKAKQNMRNAVGRLGDGAAYIEVLTFIGASHILSGDSELGADAFRDVVLFDKRKSLDPRVFPPSMIEIFNAAKAEVAAAPVGTAQIKSNPPACEVYLNGVYQGVTPVTLTKIPEGTHFVRVERDGYLPWGQLVDFFAAHEQQVEAALKTGPGMSQFKTLTKGLLGDLDDEEPAEEVVKFGQWLGVERLVVVGVKQRGGEVFAEAALIALEPSKQISYRTATLDLTSANFLARTDALFTSLYSKVKIPAGRQKKQTGIKDDVVAASCNTDTDCATGEVCDTTSGRCIPYAPEKDQFYETWWFWTIVGGGLLVAGGAGLLTWYLLKPEQGAIEFTF